VEYAKPIFLYYAAQEVKIETPIKRGNTAVNVFKNIELCDLLASVWPGNVLKHTRMKHSL